MWHSRKMAVRVAVGRRVPFQFRGEWNINVPPDSATSDITRLLQQAIRGDAGAERQLLARIYDRLTREAELVLRDHGGSLEPAELVHEVWMRIFRSDAAPEFRQRQAFFAYAARAMRHLLVDRARQRRTGTEGGDWTRIAIDIDQLVAAYRREAQADLVDLDAALEELKQESERLFRTVEMKFFGGATMKQIAEFHGVSLTTAENDWALARAKLRRRLRDAFRPE